MLLAIHTGVVSAFWWNLAILFRVHKGGDGPLPEEIIVDYAVRLEKALGRKKVMVSMASCSDFKPRESTAVTLICQSAISRWHIAFHQSQG